MASRTLKIANNKQMEADAIEIRMRAVCRLGELMAKQKETVGLAKGGGDQKSDHQGIKNPGDPPTLAEAGIDKNLAKQARKLSSISEKKFESGVKEMRENIASAIDKVSIKMANPPSKPRARSATRSKIPQEGAAASVRQRPGGAPIFVGFLWVVFRTEVPDPRTSVLARPNHKA
jgi:hypothetical protein